LQALQNFRIEWKSMRRMFVKDGFEPIFAAKDKSTVSNQVCKSNIQGVVMQPWWKSAYRAMEQNLNHMYVDPLCSCFDVPC
jgi:hypothetical protein